MILDLFTDRAEHVVTKRGDDAHTFRFHLRDPDRQPFDFTGTGLTPANLLVHFTSVLAGVTTSIVPDNILTPLTDGIIDVAFAPKLNALLANIDTYRIEVEINVIGARQSFPGGITPMEWETVADAA